MWPYFWLLVSSLCDAVGFYFAARMQDNRHNFIIAIVGYGLGIGIYLWNQESLRAVGVVDPRVQTLLWFVFTLAGVFIIGLILKDTLKWDPIGVILYLIAIFAMAGAMWRLG